MAHHRRIHRGRVATGDVIAIDSPGTFFLIGYIGSVRSELVQPDIGGFVDDLSAGYINKRKNSENSKANRIETMKGPAESGQIWFGGSKKNSEENSEK